MKVKKWYSSRVALIYSCRIDSIKDTVNALHTYQENNDVCAIQLYIYIYS